MDFIHGLTEEEAEKQMKKFGSNIISKKEQSPAVSAFVGQFKNYMVYVLLIAIILSVAVDEILNARVITAILAIIIFLGFIQEYKATKAMESLRAMLSLFSRVVRKGQEIEMLSSEIVPEDLLLLKAGERVPADAIIIFSKDLFVDESVLTGESAAREKTAHNNLSDLHSAGDNAKLFTGTYIVSGKARAIVTHTGMNTRFGKIAELVGRESEEIPLEKDIRRISKYLLFGVVLVAMVVFLILWRSQGYEIGSETADIAIIVIALAVAGIPEGMPVVVTIMLAIGMERMASRNAIVRKMAAVETLGTVTVICTDKTGTLTKNEMTVERLFFGGRMIDFSKVRQRSGKDLKSDSMFPLIRVMALCNDAAGNDENANPAEKKAVGQPTEAAILAAASRLGANKKDLDSMFPRVDESPFSSERKFMSTVHSGKGGGLFLATKGSFEAVLARCSGIMDGSSKARRITGKDIKRLEEAHANLCRGAMRVIAFASRDLHTKKLPKDISCAEKDMTFLGLAGIMDPLRPEAGASVRKCMDAGIKVVMITGDHPDTAAAIGRQLGIISGRSEVISGSEIDDMNDDELKDCVKDIKIYARARPEHKLRIVNALESLGEVVAMTGDGVNDAPALKRADVGVAMGISGTDVSREASDIVLKDDNFATIVEAVEEGRHIFNNIRKFVSYQLSCNFAEVSVIALSVILGMSLPLIALQILFINLVTDDLPSIALSQNNKSRSLMKSGPRKPDENMINRRLLAMIIIVGSVLAACIISVFQLNLWRGVETARTMAMVSLILTELTIIFSFSSLRKPLSKINIFSNKWLIAAVAASLASTVAIVYVPALASIFGTQPLGFPQWIFGFAPALAVLAIVEAYKRYELRRIR